jgi:hypothetical protein
LKLGFEAADVAPVLEVLQLDADVLVGYLQVVRLHGSSYQ